MQFILLSVHENTLCIKHIKHIMHINKLFSYMSHLKLNTFRKLYYFHDARNRFICAVSPFGSVP